MAFFRLENDIQHYAWGSKDRISHWANQPQWLTGEPVAEMWVGAHASLPSKLAATGEKLDDYIRSHAQEVLGEKLAAKQKEFPYLLKLLSAAKPLSIQVHPNKAQAEEGFRREQQQNVPAEKRNYSDPNHKPEIMLALEPFKALIGLKPVEKISAIIADLPAGTARQQLSYLLTASEGNLYSEFTQWIFSLNEEQRVEAISPLVTMPSMLKEMQTIQMLFKHYGYDKGVLMPLVMNVVDLEPGEAVFLEAGVPHAYLMGIGIEVMASSDNVLRGGLTNKYIDQDELMKVVRFEAFHPEIQKVELHSDQPFAFKIPVDDFQMSWEKGEGNTKLGCMDSPELVYVVSGELTVNGETFGQGESLLVTAGDSYNNAQLKGSIVKVYSKLANEPC